MTQESALERHWRLLRVLSTQSSGSSVRELMHETGVSEKTIRRDLILLRRVGFPLEETIVEKNLKLWKLNAEAAFPGMIRWDEAAALYVGRELMNSMRGTGLETAFRSIAEKIEQALPKDVRALLDHVVARWHIATGPQPDYSRHNDFLEALQTAVEEQRLTWLTYQSQASTEPVTYDVHPLGIVFAKNSFYLIAHSPHHGEIRHFKLDRISDVDAQQMKFPKPTDFNLEQHLAGSWCIFRGKTSEPITVRVRFTSSVARFVQEKRWHPTQKLTPQPDSSLTAEYQLNALEELKAWVLSFGAKAEVLEPESLRQEISQELIQALVAYQKHSESTSTATPRKRRLPK